MHNALVLVPLLVLGWTGTLDGIPVLAEPLYPTQENFDVTHRVARHLPNLVAAEEDGSGASDGDTLIFNGTEACQAAPDTGPCFGLYPRFYYNASSMSCHLFNYGGCMGNQNSFVSEKDCLQRCRTEAVCRLPMAAQPCTGQPPVWAFDSHSGLCVLYKQGFCQANANKFYSKAECQEYCGVIKDDAELLEEE